MAPYYQIPAKNLRGRMKTCEVSLMIDDAFWRKWLLAACVLFGVQGVWSAFTSSPDPFGIWNDRIANTFGENGSLSNESMAVKSFLHGPLGGTLAGYFVMAFFLVYHGFPARTRWTYHAVIAGLLVWFVIDSTVSCLHGAFFNVAMVNIPALVLLGLPLVMLRKAFYAATSSS
jgi:hypothetical protein